MKLLILGGNGFLGQELIQSAIKKRLRCHLFIKTFWKWRYFFTSKSNLS